MNYCNSTSSWKPWRWVSLDLIFTMTDICINSNLNPLTKFTSSSTSTEFKNIFLWNIPQMIMRTVLFSTRIVMSYATKQGIRFWVLKKVNGNWGNKMISGGNAIVEQMLASEQRNKCKRARLWEPQSGILVGALIIWVRLFEFTRSISSTRMG